MIPLPKPRGFGDYTLFGLIMSGALLFLFWLDASDGVRWTDATLAFVAAVLIVSVIIVVCRGEKARWMAQPTRYAHLFAVLGAFGLTFGAMYVDAYLLHRRNIPSDRLRDDMVSAVVLTSVMLWSLRRRRTAGRRLL